MMEQKLVTLSNTSSQTHHTFDMIAIMMQYLLVCKYSQLQSTKAPENVDALKIHLSTVHRRILVLHLHLERKGNGLVSLSSNISELVLPKSNQI